MKRDRGTLFVHFRRLPFLSWCRYNVIGLTFLLLDSEKYPNRCEISLESYCDCTSSGREAEVAEQIAVAALKALRLEQSVCVVREGHRTTIKGKLSLKSSRGFKRRERGSDDRNPVG